MVSTFSVAQLGHGGASRAIREAEHEPVLVSRGNRPAAWILSAERLARVAAAHGEEAMATYERALELLAVELYQNGTLTLGQGAKLAGLSLGDFIDLCGRLRVPVLWAPQGGVARDMERLKELLAQSETGAKGSP